MEAAGFAFTKIDKWGDRGLRAKLADKHGRARLIKDGHRQMRK